MAPSELRAEGDLVLEGTFGATIGIDLRNVDLQALSPPAPHSTLALHADVQLDARSGGMLAGRFTTSVAGGEIGGEVVPGGAFDGDFEQKEPSRNGSSQGGVEVKIEGTVAEPGAPVEVRADVRTDAPAPRVDFDVSSHVVRLSEVRRWNGLGPGGGDLRVQGAITLGATPSVDAALAGSVEGLAYAGARLEKGHLAAHAFGSFTNPEVDATLEADGVQITRYKFRHARVTTAGRLYAERVTIGLEGDGAPNLRASATIGISAAPTFENVDADLSRGPHALHASASRVKVDHTGVAVAGASITGVGEPIRASLDTRRGSLVLQGTSKGVDLGALGYLLGFEDKLRSGRLAFAVDLAARRDGADGSATVDLDHGSFAGLDDVSGHIETRMQGRKVTGTVKTSVGDVGTLDVSRMKLDVGGKGPLEADSWRRTWGVLQINGQLDLAKAAALLPPNTLPVSKLAGRLTLQGALRRDDESDVTPDVALTLKTSGLRFAPRGGPDEMRNGTIVVATPPWESSGIDVQLDVRADGDSGFAEIAARLVDKEGIIVSLDAKSAGVPYERLFASDVAAELLKDIPVSAVIVVPARKLDHLPDLLKPAGASGDAEARVAIEGTFRKPTIDATAKTHSVKFDRSPLTGGLNADLTAKYDGATADLAIDARSSRNGVVHATARVNAKVDDMLSHPVPWDASAKATFERFPLGSIVGMSDRDVRGQMSGRVELTDWHKDARAIVDLDLANLRVGAQTFRRGKVKVTLDGHSFGASARLERADAVASATANVGTIWGANLAPSVDPAGSSDASFQARHFPAAILTPFAEGILDELEGTIDADAHVALRPNEKATMQGSVVLRDGVVELTAVGEELHGVNAKVVFAPDGIVRLESLTAFGTSGKLTASGEARMDGLHLVGAEAVLNIPKGDAMPFALQGASLGSVYGKLALKAIGSPDHKALSVKIDAESLHIDLPEASSHSVEDLDAAEPGTHVGIYASPDRFVLLPLDEFDAEQALEVPTKSSNTLTVDVHLGQNVEIQRGTDLKVDLDGDLTAKIGDPTEVTGQIHLRSGKLDVQGKSFEIEKGTVTFLGDSANPELNVTASWTAGDGTRVYADYVGPLKTGKVILRSEPARPQNEILALILFGSADGLQPAPSAGGSQTDSATKAGAAVGGFATAGLSKGLNKLTGMQISAKVDTSGTTTKPEVAVQIAKDISLQVAVVLGTLPITNPDTTYATIDWRFFKDWSLETTFGDKGTSIADVVWQHRY
jgi:translocation and assembly module TamB